MVTKTRRSKRDRPPSAAAVAAAASSPDPPPPAAKRARGARKSAAAADDDAPLPPAEVDLHLEEEEPPAAAAAEDGEAKKADAAAEAEKKEKKPPARPTVSASAIKALTWAKARELMLPFLSEEEKATVHKKNRAEMANLLEARVRSGDVSAEKFWEVAGSDGAPGRVRRDKTRSDAMEKAKDPVVERAVERARARADEMSAAVLDKMGKEGADGDGSKSPVAKKQQDEKKKKEKKKKSSPPRLNKMFPCAHNPPPMAPAGSPMRRAEVATALLMRRGDADLPNPSDIDKFNRQVEFNRQMAQSQASYPYPGPVMATVHRPPPPPLTPKELAAMAGAGPGRGANPKELAAMVKSGTAASPPGPAGRGVVSSSPQGPPGAFFYGQHPAMGGAMGWRGPPPRPGVPGMQVVPIPMGGGGGPPVPPPHMRPPPPPPPSGRLAKYTLCAPPSVWPSTTYPPGIVIGEQMNPYPLTSSPVVVGTFRSSSVLPLGPDGEALRGGDAGKQMEEVLSTVDALLRQMGGSRLDLVAIRAHVVDVAENGGAVLDAYAAYCSGRVFRRGGGEGDDNDGGGDREMEGGGSTVCSWSMVGASGLHPAGCLVQVEVEAVVRRCALATLMREAPPPTPAPASSSPRRPSPAKNTSPAKKKKAGPLEESIARKLRAEGGRADKSSPSTKKK